MLNVGHFLLFEEIALVLEELTKYKKPKVAKNQNYDSCTNTIIIEFINVLIRVITPGNQI